MLDLSLTLKAFRQSDDFIMSGRVFQVFGPLYDKLFLKRFVLNLGKRYELSDLVLCS